MAPEAPTVSDPLIHTTVVVPAFNEEEALPVVLEKVLAAVDAGYEVLVVDDGSTDGTRAVAGRFNCRLIAYETNRGKAAAMRIGIREARGENVIFIDADDTYPADIIPQIVSELSAFDMVVCSRAGGHANIPAFNRIGNAIFRNSIRYLYNFPAYDPLTGFYGVKRRHLLRMDLRSEGFRIESEIAIKAARMGLEIHDIPIRYRPRLGQAKLRGLQDGYTIFATIISMFPLYCPTFLLVLPGLILGLGALALLGVLARTNVDILGATFGFNSFVLAAFALLLTALLVYFGLALGIYAAAHRDSRPDRLTRLVMRRGPRRGLGLAGLGLVLAGLIWAAIEGPAWLTGQFAASAEVKRLVTVALLLSLGLQATAASAFLTVLAADAAQPESRKAPAEKQHLLG